MNVPRPNLVTAVIVCAFIVPTVFSIQCYKCSSAYDENCGNPQKFKVFNVGCPPSVIACKKVLRYQDNTIYIIRDCAGDLSKEGKPCFKTNEGDDYCRCFTDLCNASSRRSWTLFSIILPAWVLIVLWRWIQP